MKRILFLCSGNYYRSRIAEELFNHHAIDGWRAHSKGLSERFPISGNPGPMSPYAIYYLKSIGVRIQSEGRMPEGCSAEDLNACDRIVCMDADEHTPMLARFGGIDMSRVAFWHVKDIDEMPFEVATRLIEENVLELLRTLT